MQPLSNKSQGFQNACIFSTHDPKCLALFIFYMPIVENSNKIWLPCAKYEVGFKQNATLN